MSLWRYGQLALLPFLWCSLTNECLLRKTSIWLLCEIQNSPCSICGIVRGYGTHDNAQAHDILATSLISAERTSIDEPPRFKLKHWALCLIFIGPSSLSKNASTGRVSVKDPALLIFPNALHTLALPVAEGKILACNMGAIVTASTS